MPAGPGLFDIDIRDIYIYMRMASATARATYDNIRHDRLQLMTNTNMAVLPLRAGRPRLRGSSR